MSPGLLILLSFLAAATLVVAVYSFLADVYLRDRSRVSRRVDEEFRERQREQAQRSALFKDLGPSKLGGQAADDVPDLRERLELLLEQSGLNLTLGRLLAYAAACGLALGVVAGLLSRSAIAGAAAALAGAAVPPLYVLYKRRVRLEKLLAQLPDAFDLMARVICAGQTMSQGIQAVADEFDQPIAGEFNYCFEQQNLGLPAELALRDLTRRTGLLELRIFVLAVLVQQQTGGNLAELLDRLAAIIRERFRMRGRIRALTAEGRLQAVILLALPVVVFLAIYTLNRGYAEILLERPWLLVGMGVSEALGMFFIHRIVNFDF
jgi:tight adherence protein B